ncbi:hypothetical protein Tco_0357208 [Tanacetum coccineum]
MYQSHPIIHLSQEVLDLKKKKDAQAVEILRLKKRIDAVSLVTGSCGIGLSRKVRTMERAAQEEGFIFTLYEEIKKSVAAESEEKKSKRIKRVVDSALKHKSSKKQKMMQEQESAKSDEDAAADYEHEKEELIMWLIVVPDEEETVDPEILSAKLVKPWKLMRGEKYPGIIGILEKVLNLQLGKLMMKESTIAHLRLSSSSNHCLKRVVMCLDSSPGVY